MMKNTFYLLFSLLIGLATPAYSQSIGDFGSVADGNWSAPSSWLLWDGFGFNTSTAVAPSALSNVHIANGHTINVDIAASCKNINIYPGTTLNLSANITISNLLQIDGNLNFGSSGANLIQSKDQAGNYLFGSGKIDMSGSSGNTLTMAGWNNNFNGMFDPGTGTVVYNGNPSAGNSQYVIYFNNINAMATPYYDLVITGSGNKIFNSGYYYIHSLKINGSATFQTGSAFIYQDIIISGTGVYDLSNVGGAYVILKGNWSNWSTAGFLEGTSKIEFEAANATMTCPGGEDFYDLVVALGTTLTLSNNVKVAHDLWIDGVLSFGSSPITVTQSMDQAGNYLFGGGKIDMSGNSGDTLKLAGWNNNFNGMFDPGTGTVVYNGNPTLFNSQYVVYFSNVNVGSTPYYDLVITGSGNKIFNSGYYYLHNLKIKGSANFQTGSAMINQDIIISENGVYDLAGLFTSPYIILKGNWSNWSTAGFLEGTSKIEFEAANPTMTCPGGEDFYDLVVALGTTLTLSNNVKVAHDLWVDGVLSFGSSPITVTQSMDQAGNYLFGGGKIDMSGNSGDTLKLAGWNNNFNGMFDPGTGTVVYNGNPSLFNSQYVVYFSNVNAGSTPYYDLVISGSGNKIFNSGYYYLHNLKIKGSANFQTVGSTINQDIIISENGVYDLAGLFTSPYIILKGNWTNWSTAGFNEGFSTIEFEGTNVNIACPGGEDFFNMVEGGFTTGGIHLADPVTINNSLTFYVGIIDAKTNNLIIANGAGVSNANNASYVDGNVTKIGNSSFTYPVGNGGYYRPISITAPSNTSDAFTARYYYTSSGLTTYGPGVHHTSNIEYWTLDRTTGSSIVDVTLSWNNNSQVTNLGDLIVCHWNGTQWDSQGNGGTTGTVTAGTIINSIAFTSYSPITFGSAAGANSLPVDIIDFTAVAHNETVDLQWKTSMIGNADFTLEKSMDGIHWESIITVKKEDNEDEFSYKDINKQSHEVYYRLKMDEDNAIKYSDIREVAVSVNEPVFYPNPTSGSFSINFNEQLDEIYLLQIKDVSGKIVLENYINTSAGIKVFIGNISSLPSGVYTWSIKSENNFYINTFVKN